MGKRKHYKAEEKISLLKRHLAEKIPVSDLCDEHGMHPTMFFRWQKTLFERGGVVFNSGRDSETKQLRKRVADLEAKLNKKNEVLAEVMEEYVLCKKKHGGA